MIIAEKTGNILTSPAQTLVNPVNTMGAMGSGLAFHFKLAFPGLLDAYREACRKRYFFKYGFYVYNHVPTSKKILCFPTKRDWRKPSKLIYIDEGLRRLAHDYRIYGITSLAVPALGCGLGGLQWEEVRPLLYSYLDDLPIEVTIYLPRK